MPTPGQTTHHAAATARTGLVMALVSAAMFGLSGPLAKSLIDAGWTSGGTALVRLGGAAVVLAVVLAVTRPGVLAALRDDAPALLLYGVLATAGTQVGFFNAVRYLPVPVALLIEYTGPVLVIVWVWVVRRRPPGARTLLGAALALAGLVLVVQLWSSSGVRIEGLVWGLVAAVCQAGYFLLADRADSHTPPLVLAGVGMAVGTLLVALIGLAGLLPVAIDREATGVMLAGVDVGWPLTAALLVGLATVIAYLTGIGAVARIGASRASLIALLEVLASTAASWWLLGQVPTPIQAVGGALIMAGVTLTGTGRPPEPAHP